MLTVIRNAPMMQNKLVRVPVETFAVGGAFTWTLCIVAFSFGSHQWFQSFQHCSHSSPCIACKQLSAQGIFLIKVVFHSDIRYSNNC